jgi:hypothetical protein
MEQVVSDGTEADEPPLPVYSSGSGEREAKPHEAMAWLEHQSALHPSALNKRSVREEDSDEEASPPAKSRCVQRWMGHSRGSDGLTIGSAGNPLQVQSAENGMSEWSYAVYRCDIHLSFTSPTFTDK